ncbi:transposase [Mycobacterium lentiflavum]|uniref:Transposase n=1 Tax=Mycobacterium lentiflavum TaxID=141349 RepID=A0A0E4H2M2_MYCLN|nr:hypothetical protein [Mycobacterium lentiflavum]CQD24409.1 transposase [Mycobacterium lentiflavum]
MAYVRTVKTSSGATAVQIVWSWRKGSRQIEHLGSAHEDAELAALKTAAAERLAAGQAELDLGISGSTEPGTLPILSSRMSHLWDLTWVVEGDRVRPRHYPPRSCPYLDDNLMNREMYDHVREQPFRSTSRLAFRLRR